MKFEDLEIGQHLWVSLNDKLLMVAKFNSVRYEVCGPWECGVSPEECKIIELVNKPKINKEIKFYYNR